MFSFPTRQDALNVRDACAQGNTDEAERLCDQSFHPGMWGHPGEDSEQCTTFLKQEMEVANNILKWQEEWLTAAVEGSHARVVRWLEDNWLQDNLDVSFEQRIAKIHLHKMCSPSGTVDDALMACTPWWLLVEDDEHDEYQYAKRPKRVWWGMFCLYDYTEERFRMVEKLFDVDPEVELTPVFETTHPKLVLFGYSTPDYVIDALHAESPESDIVGYIIRKACRYFLGADAPADSVNGSRLVRIAKELVDMGFAFHMQVFSLVDYCVRYDPAVMVLMSKMLCIHGGRGEVRLQLNWYDQKTARRRNVFVYCVCKFAIVALRARKRTWAPGSIHVVALGSSFLARCEGL